MDCESYRRKYLDHDWTRQSLADAAIVSEHLRNCPACMKTAQQYDHVRHVLGSADPLSDLRLARRPAKPATLTRQISLWLGVAAAMAPAIVAGIFGWMIYQQRRQEMITKQLDNSAAIQQLATQTPATGHQPLANATLTPEDVNRGMQLFQEVSATFDGRTSWVALGDRSTDMGLSSGNGDSNPKVFLVRLVFFHGRDEKSRTDLVIVAGQNARMELPLEPGRILHYVIGTSVGEPPKLSLWTEVRSPHGGEAMAVLATEMRPRSGETLDAGRIVTSTGDYSLEVSFMEQTLPGQRKAETTSEASSQKLKS